MLSARSSALLLGLATAALALHLHRKQVRWKAAASRWLCHRLPKVELHAHLHGSARLSTISDLAPPGVDQTLLTDDTKRSLEGCFAIFGAIHRTVTSLAAVRRITEEVLSDFAADNVKYLELRTTPRVLADADIEGYVRTVLSVFEQFELSSRRGGAAFPLVPRLILSIDRSGSAEAALATVALAAHLRAEGGVGRYVVGIDFSGNPTVSGFAQFAEAFAAARRAGLRTVVHVAEVVNDVDTDAILAFRPERLGHALHLSAAHIAALEAAPIPIELCPTSNMKTLRLRSLADHPTLRHWIDGGYPVSISTDDSGVFATSASVELALVADALGLQPCRIAELATAALDHVLDANAAFGRQFRADVEAALAECALHDSRACLHV